MTTHVFIVSEKTFRIHLEYLFAGTGAGEKDVDFNNSPDSDLYSWKDYHSENGIVSMMADCCRVREGDYVLFYLQATKAQEGRFFGVFKVAGEPFLDKKDNPNHTLNNQLGKNLTFRIRIRPYEVYSKGVTEWKALDEIRSISSPYQMLWSLIYRKLKGNRGNTMITIYESERLIDLIRRENNNTSLTGSQGYTYQNQSIQPCSIVSCYPNNYEPFNILPRLISKHNAKKAYEAHLQMYITQTIGRNPTLDQALGITDYKTEWIGNEVSCGVGMQRIDVMLSEVVNDTTRIVMPIELKAVQVYPDVIKQINRYIDWIELYYIPNRISTIQPVLICLKGGLTEQIKRLFFEFNASAKGRYLPLKYVEYSVSKKELLFENIIY